MSTYQKLEALIYNPSVRTLTLSVCDNCFDKTKADFLYHALSKSSLKGFTFINNAIPCDYDANEYSDFKKNMKPIKSLSLMSDIKWFTEVVF